MSIFFLYQKWTEASDFLACGLVGVVVKDKSELDVRYYWDIISRLLDKFRLNNIIDDGGWHFCNLKKPELLLHKYKNLCETNDPHVFKEKIDEKYLNLDDR